MVLEFNGDRMAPAVESTPHAIAMIFNGTLKGLRLSPTLWKTTLCAKKQTGEEEVPLRLTSGYHLPANPWPKTEEALTKNNAFAFANKKRYGYRQEQGNRWEQYGDSSSAAAA